MSRWETHRIPTLICSVAVLIVLGTSAFIIRNPSDQLAEDEGRQPRVKTASEGQDVPPASQASETRCQFVRFDDHFQPGYYLGFFFSDPLTELGAHNLADQVMNQLRDGGKTASLIKLFGFYSEREARYGASIGGGHDAVFMVWREGDVDWEIRGVFTADPDPSRLLQDALNHDALAEYFDASRCRFEKETAALGLVRSLYLAEVDQRAYKEDARWFALVHTIIECFAPTYRASLWAVIPEIKTAEVLIVGYKSGEPIATVSGSQGAVLRLRQTRNARDDDRQLLWQEEFALSDRFAAGAMAKGEYERAVADVKKRVVDLYTDIWVEASSAFRVEILDDSYRRGGGAEESRFSPLDRGKDRFIVPR